ncbi:4-hydroxybenzoyl-CoA reductase subunit alpha [Rhodopseudomonas palustris]|uniref:4-hydroxybenzoyl-CoA reductase subunit alpha n=1 Tax=Rhodopseudomonas palustris (strain ATCC BAA-98 / CGA009) TaxID=258594 RepID=Q6NC04_RHOPA|nr:4-hydroxybenzoyl-CoA reductase subunit alpha [Rhodopseudomonas palustris]OPF94716.1 4-hydroxybenzoyl-CoA reductase subunit alpha [Rhodopseudomonas palustris]RJF63624.1 4-hydroxybenzoyl-CoA reductase subunit alpha [Rhodopseudomonas palustris]WAB78368.1 4-hydroxybenzoyl-CoA reductase subunit alpha [Rhodopseudomonas palustris]WCL90803.1 4-hydroxybenzoyl-CoA reductase subunit alpha [Rhodopseudomonas palustris CGA009]WND52273.1 4-hydroxybenzoyl-CoA reductase subunit alpha [Rhodopseudomonas palus
MSGPAFQGGLDRAGVPLVDGIDKVTGRARYTADLDHTGALVARILRSPISHGDIVRLDVSKALALDGVAAIVTGEDCAITYGVLPIAMNEYPMARDRVRYRGEPVAAVAAVDAETARQALDLIELELRELPAYYESEAARAPDAWLLHDNKPGNIEREVHNEFGDLAAGFEAADLIRTHTHHCAEVNHAQIEPHACLMDYDPVTGRLTAQSVSQVGYYLHLMLARCLEIDPSRVRVIKPFVGGGFGARVEVLNFEVIAALLARKASGRVLMRLSREETFITHRARPQTDITLTIGTRRDGRFTACSCEVVQRGGAYAGYGIVTILYAGALLQGLYDIPAVKYDGYRVYTNLPPCGAMRGHGSVDVRHAFENLVDRMARELGLDPFAVRRANLLAAPTRTLNDLMVNSYGLAECLDKVERASGWHERIGRLPPGKGLGMACSHYVSGSAKPIHFTGEPHAVVALRLDFDGGITALTGAADIGQGSSTVVAITVAETLGVALNRVRVISGDSAITPKDNGAYSSRITFMVGNAAIDAATKLKQILIAAAARKLEAVPEQIECAGESFFIGSGAQAALGFAEVVKAALVDEGAITVKGIFTCPPESQGGQHRGGAVGSTMGFSYAAQVVEVSVDDATGLITVDKVWAALDCGRAINPLAVVGQVQGAVWMGMGQAMCEETRYLDGLPAHASFLEYRMPTMIESPPIEVAIVESVDPFGPFGAKEASEGALAGFPPAMVNAVANAIGIDLDDLPATPDRVVEALARRRREAKRAVAVRAAS